MDAADNGGQVPVIEMIKDFKLNKKFSDYEHKDIITASFRLIAKSGENPNTKYEDT